MDSQMRLRLRALLADLQGEDIPEEPDETEKAPVEDDRSHTPTMERLRPLVQELNKRGRHPW